MSTIYVVGTIKVVVASDKNNIHVFSAKEAAPSTTWVVTPSWPSEGLDTHFPYLYQQDEHIVGLWHVPCSDVRVMNGLQNLYSIHQLQIIY
jgi:hypothetical protein